MHFCLQATSVPSLHCHTASYSGTGGNHDCRGKNFEQKKSHMKRKGWGYEGMVVGELGARRSHSETSAASQRRDPGGSLEGSMSLSTKWSVTRILQDPCCFQQSLSSSIISDHILIWCFAWDTAGLFQRWETRFALSIPNLLRPGWIEASPNVLSNLLIWKTEKNSNEFSTWLWE